MSEETRVGFIGLGNMGRPIANNIAAGGHDMIVYDAAGTAERAPEGAAVAASVAEVANNADHVLLSLPDGAIVASVAEEIIESNARRVATVADTSTVGIEAAQSVHKRLGDAGIEYVDAPVSGGTAGAAAGTISVMFAGANETFKRLLPVFQAMSTNVFYIGPEPGQGQAMKVANNFLSATAMAATSEAIAFGTELDLDPNVMVAVLNASSGQNTATSDKFPNRVLNDKYDAGFTNTLLHKDVNLYLEAARQAGTPDAVASVTVDYWLRFKEAEPGVDFTRIYPFIRDGR
ncbi:MAG: NAD(P)-dependent oxidoreductase [Alphaproteobacteria bacterium]|nr:NAD(P)-dependent oxidoreductase [Alphaproteobacteria bacterium]